MCRNTPTGKGLPFRIVAVGLATIVVSILLWLTSPMVGIDDQTRNVVVPIAALIVVTLGAVWVSRAKHSEHETSAPPPATPGDRRETNIARADDHSTAFIVTGDGNKISLPRP